MRNSVSPLRYPGGKSCLVPLLSDIVIKNNLSDCVFVEPFAGSSAAALHLLLGEHVDRILINDRDYRIYSFWWSVLNEPDRLIALVRSEPVTIENWHTQRRRYLNPGRLLPLTVGFATLFLNRCNRSGIISTGGPIGGYEQSGEWKLDVRYDAERLCDRIHRISAYSERIQLENRDGLALLGRIVQRRKDTNKHFVFLDPPYVEKGNRLYQSDFTTRTHERLAMHLLDSARYPWVLTYDDVPLIRRLYRKRKPFPYLLGYAAQRKRQGRELMVHSTRLKIDREFAPGGASYF